MSPDDVTEFQPDVSTFMETARREVAVRQLGNITPNLHLLEAHLPGAVKEFGNGMGLLAEQGGESIHREFNSLQHRHEGIVNEQQRLRTTVKQHLSSTLPRQVPLFPGSRKRKHYDSSSSACNEDREE